MPAAVLRRRTPRPAELRLAMLSLFAAGLGFGFLSLLAWRDMLFGTLGVPGIATAFLGALLAALPGRRLVGRALDARGMRRLLLAFAGVSAAGLVVLHVAGLVAGGGSAAFYVLPLFLLGLATGACSRLSAALVMGILPARCSASLLSAGGVSFGLGGAAASLLGVLALRSFAAGSLVLWAAAAPALLGYLALRAGAARLRGEGAARGGASVGPRGGERRPGSQRRSLMAVSLLCQAGAWGVATCCLPVHLLRGAGASGVVGAGALTAFWIAASTGWAASRRLPRIGQSPLTLVLPLALAAAAGLLLLTRWVPAVGLGAGLLGGGLGLLLPLTLDLGRWPSVLGGGGWLEAAVAGAVPAATLAVGLVGALPFGIGPMAAVVSAVGCVMLALATLGLLLADYRLSGGPALV